MKKHELQGSKPKQERVLNAIRSSIESGQLRPGERIASLTELSECFDVSKSVAYRALQQLTGECLVESRGIRGFYVSGDSPQQFPSPPPCDDAASPSDNDDGQIFLTGSHHSDLVWKHTYGRYRQIRASQLDRVMKLFDDDDFFCFFEEQVEVMREYLEDHPEHLSRVRALVAEGRLAMAANNSIPDLNMVCGEQLVRDLARGLAYCRDVLGCTPAIACYTDAFGMNCQLPQILSQFGIRFLHCGRLPNFPSGHSAASPFTWCGCDGSEATAVMPGFCVDFQAFLCNAPYTRTARSRLQENVNTLRQSPFSGDLLAEFSSETMVLPEEIFSAIERANRGNGRHIVKFGSIEEYCRRLDRQRLPVIRGEFNPVFTGCYTTRIGVKQKARKVENLLFAAELLGAAVNRPTDLDPAWELLTSACFHDGLCGCHTDAANAEIMERLEEAARRCRQQLGELAPRSGFVFLNPGPGGVTAVEFTQQGDYLPMGVPLQRDGDRICFTADLPPTGLAAFRSARGLQAASAAECPPVFSTRCFDVDFTSPMPKIACRGRSGGDIFPKDGFGEVLFRHDPGSMWSECYGGEYFGAGYQHEEVVSCQGGPVYHEVITSGHALPHPADDGHDGDYWDCFGSLKFRKTWRFYRDLDYFTLKVRLEWHGDNTKISIRFPLGIEASAAEATYDVPFGAIVRKPYYEVPEKYKDTLQMLTDARCYEHAAGDWPALNWVDYCDMEHGVSIANTGTPGHQLVGGAVIVSLLRSGTRIADGFTRPQPGALDNGVHEYEFAFRPHSGRDSLNAANLGALLNRKPMLLHAGESKRKSAMSVFPHPPLNLRISSIRHTARGVVVRMYETAGMKTLFSVPSTAMVSDLREEKWEPVAGRIVWAPFEIKTILLPGR